MDSNLNRFDGFKVEDKEQRLEKKIDRQAAKIERGDRDVDMEGLDKKHRLMLRVGAPHHA